MEPMKDNTSEQSLEQLARRMEYPPTPDIVAGIRPMTTDHGQRPSDNDARVGRRLAWSLALVALLAAALAVPQTRAAVLYLFARVGAIDIFIDDAAPAPPTIAATLAPAATAPDRAAHSLALFELGQPVTLDEARQAADFPLVVPESLGQPDEVYIHRNVDLPAITLVWRDEDGAPLSLTEIGAAGFALKMVAGEGVQWVSAGGSDAAWLEGPHTLQLFGYEDASRLLIESNVLIWTDESLTYRLEGALGEAEMIAIAESILE